MTKAILAHGLHTIYPKENEGLALNIIESGGVLLSEYFVGEGHAQTFCRRDRLQSGLSNATIVSKQVLRVVLCMR
jgi:DNA processing protein